MSREHLSWWYRGVVIVREYLCGVSLEDCLIRTGKGVEVVKIKVEEEEGESWGDKDGS